jgi:hypothetical protein
MKAMMIRTVYALVAAVVVAGGMLMTAKPAAAAPQGCYLVMHRGEETVINANAWKAHYSHGDALLSDDVPCEDDVVL